MSRSHAASLDREGLLAIKARVAAGRVLDREGRFARVTVHMGTCGIASGAQDVLEAIQAARGASCDTGAVQLICTGCIGLCCQEPLITVERQGLEPIIYGRVDPELACHIYREHVRGGKPVIAAALARGTATDQTEPDPHSPLAGLVPHVRELDFFAMQELWVLRNKGLIDPDEIDEAIWRDAYQGAWRAFVELEAGEIVAEVKESGLRGRGGGGFPTGLKWEFCAASRGGVKYVLCNADEGDPGAFMDRAVLEGDPHAVLEGMLIAARAIGAHQGYIYCRAEYPLAVRRLERAIAQARQYGLLGPDVFGTGHGFDVEVYQGAGAFVCGEETALMRSLEGRRGMPRPRPPFPAVSGLWGKPTVLNNVETYANVGQIILRGGAAYARLGTTSSKGTKVFALTGKVRNIGLVEVVMGTTIGRVIFDIGGGIPGGKRFKAVQLGGPSGGCVPAAHLDTPIDYEAIASVGAIVGSGGMIVMDQDTCMVDMARYFMDFCADESCGQCAPCRIGTTRMRDILERICRGEGRLEDLALLEDLSATVKDASLCGLGQTAPNPVLSTLRYFRDEYERHVLDRECPAVSCCELFTSPCQGACPLDTDVPGYIGLIRAGRLEEAYGLISQSNPFAAVCGRVCSRPCESKCRRAQLDEPVAIMHLKRYVTDHAHRPRVRPLPVTQPERVAIIGAGPAGLTAARELRRRGYPVTVYEALPEPGGMLRWGIPAYRLPRDILARDIADILATGIDLRLSTRIGHDLPFADLEVSCAAIYIAVGAQRSARLAIPGENLPGVHGALELLRAHNLGEPVSLRGRVAVIGGGNSAVDAARCALRLGADSVTIYYRRERGDMPAIPWEIAAAEEEGVKLELLTAPIEVIGEQGRVAGLRLARMQLGEFDRSGRTRPEAIPGSERVVPVDCVIAAIGQEAELDFLPGTTAVDVGRGLVGVDHDLRTGHPRIWAGGDVTSGPAMAVDAIRSGRRAAESIDAALLAARGRKPRRDPAPEVIQIPYEVDEEATEQPQTAMPELPASERRAGFVEVELGYTEAMARAEARRCRRCDGRRQVGGEPLAVAAGMDEEVSA
jgi:NADH-quinone oxidoreductase subunit F